MKLTEEQKQEIAAMVAKKSQGIENGVIRVWMDSSIGQFKLTTGSHEFRDEIHEPVFVFHVWNEGHSYDEIDVLDKLDENEN